MSKRIGREGNSFDQGERPRGRQVPRLTFRSHPQMLSLIDEAHVKIKMTKDEDDLYIIGAVCLSQK